MRAERGDRPVPGMPRWVKAFGLLAVVLLLLVVILHLTGLGPGDHVHMVVPSAAEAGVRQP